jgi:exodeoxyribonuclease-3
MKILSWNINGLNNILSKSKDGEKNKSHVQNNSLRIAIEEHKPDVVCLQEVRNKDALDLLTQNFKDYYNYIYVNCGKKQGYSGTAVLCNIEPTSVEYDMHDIINDEGVNDEGRTITVTFDKICVINTYSPNSKPKLERLDFRIEVWEKTLRQHISKYSRKHNIILCGDLNVAHTEADIHNPSRNGNHAGFTQRERLSFGLLLHNHRLVDAFRFLNPNTTKYSWWSNFHNSREQNKGWRIDYFVVSGSIANTLQECDILTEFYGSDHAPVLLQI